MAKIVLSANEFPIRFDLNVMGVFDKRYEVKREDGTIEKSGLMELLNKINDPDELRFILTTIINEGIAYEAYMENAPGKMVNEELIGMLVSPKEMRSQSVAQAILNAFNECMGDEKNAECGQVLKEVQQMMNQ